MERVAITERELAEEFKIPQRGLATLRKNGFIKGVKVGRKWVYPKSEIDKFFETYIGYEVSTK